MSPAPCRRRLRRGRAIWFVVSFFASAADAPAGAQPDPAQPAPPVIEAPEVTITATRRERDVLDVPGNVTVIDREAIDRSGVQNVPDLLRREAGIYVTNTTTNPLGYTVEARGFQNGGGNGCRTLVLLDGRPVNEPDTGCPDWSFISLDEIERIEVIRGPASAAYGDHAIGGVIHLVTRHGRAEEGVRAVAQGRTGSYDTDGGSLWVDGGEGPLSATAFLQDDTSDSFRDHADFRLRKGELGLRAALGEASVAELVGGYSSTNRELPGDLTRQEWSQNPRQAEPGSGDNFDEERERWARMRLAFQPIESLSLELAPYLRRTSQRTRSDEPFFTFSLDNVSDVYGVASQLAWETELSGRENRLLAGLDASQEDSDGDSVFDDGAVEFPSKTRARRKLVGVFLHEELRLAEAWILSGGVRRDRADTEGRDAIQGCEAPGACPDLRDVIWSGRGALTWRFAEPASAYASWARGFRYPNLNEAFGFFGFAPQLDPERSETWEVGLKLRQRRLAANLAIYHMNVTNEIFFDPIAENPITGFPGVNVNVDRVRHRGVEVSGSWQALEWLELHGGYTFDDVEIRLDRASPSLEGNTLPITPRHRGSAGLLLHLPWGFEVGVEVRYVGSRFLANDVENDEDGLSRFATYDARVGWSGEVLSGLRLAVDVVGFNLTDRRYAEWGGVSLFDPTDIGYFPAPERHYLAAVRLEVRR